MQYFSALGLHSSSISLRSSGTSSLYTRNTLILCKNLMTSPNTAFNSIGKHSMMSSDKHGLRVNGDVWFLWTHLRMALGCMAGRDHRRSIARRMQRKSMGCMASNLIVIFRFGYDLAGPHFERYRTLIVSTDGFPRCFFNCFPDELSFHFIEETLCGRPPLSLRWWYVFCSASHFLCSASSRFLCSSTLTYGVRRYHLFHRFRYLGHPAAGHR